VLEETVEEPILEQPSQEMIELVNTIVNEDIADDNNNITQNDLE
jgi:hypothetical protein